MQIVKKDLAKMIDHTSLGSSSSREDVERLCSEAEEGGFYSVCVEPIYVPYCVERLEGSGVKVGTVVGFPHGANKSGVKAFEAQLAIEDGADELDMVVNVPALKAHDYRAVGEDISAVAEVVEEAPREVTLKTILEMGELEKDEKVAGCVIAQASGADFVKTSTGFGPSGAKEEDVRLMREAVGSQVKVKAAGGIGDYEKACRMIEAGADRIGASSGVEIVSGAPEQLD